MREEKGAFQGEGIGAGCVDDFGEFFIAYQDFAAPKLDVYEQAIYLYIARHTLLVGATEAVIGFKSARKNMALGVGQAGTPPSEGVIYSKLKGLASKGFIEVVTSERTGTRIRISTPFEISGLVQIVSEEEAASIEDADFFADPANRKLILDRDGHKCFYCFKILDENNYVIEHVVSRPEGSNSYRNLVASCRKCNNRKDAGLAEDYFRLIYREGLLSHDELQDRLQQLDRLSRGELRPQWS
jgi:hypothetical protein